VGFDSGGATDARRVMVGRKRHRHSGQGQGVAQRNQIGGFFGTLDASNSRYANHIAFFRSSRFYQLQGGGQHMYLAGGNSNAVRVGFGANIDHVRLTLCIEMGE
jgi:hypothetical protein